MRPSSRETDPVAEADEQALREAVLAFPAIATELKQLNVTLGALLVLLTDALMPEEAEGLDTRDLDSNQASRGGSGSEFEGL